MGPSVPIGLVICPVTDRAKIYFSSYLFLVVKNVSCSSLIPWRVISLSVLSADSSAVYSFWFCTLFQSLFGVYHSIEELGTH